MGVGMVCSAQSKGDIRDSRDNGKVRCKTRRDSDYIYNYYMPE